MWHQLPLVEGVAYETLCPLATSRALGLACLGSTCEPMCPGKSGEGGHVRSASTLQLRDSACPGASRCIPQGGETSGLTSTSAQQQPASPAPTLPARAGEAEAGHSEATHGANGETAVIPRAAKRPQHKHFSSVVGSAMQKRSIQKQAIVASMAPGLLHSQATCRPASEQS